MQVAGVRLVDLEHIVLPAILDEVVRAIGQAAVKDRLVAVMIIGHANYEKLLDPTELCPKGKTGRCERLDEVGLGISLLHA
jgi:hypothetical protein